MIGNRLIISSETGEVETELRPGDRIVRFESVDYLQEYAVWKVEHFYKGNLREIKRWMKDLTPHEKAVLFTVSPYVNFSDCCLKKGDGNMLTFDYIVDLSGLSRSTVSEALNSLIEKDILYRGRNAKERQYFINPWLFCKGNRINNVLKTMFRNYKIRVMDGRQWKDIKDCELR